MDLGFQPKPLADLALRENAQDSSKSFDSWTSRHFTVLLCGGRSNGENGIGSFLPEISLAAVAELHEVTSRDTRLESDSVDENALLLQRDEMRANLAGVDDRVSTFSAMVGSAVVVMSR